MKSVRRKIARMKHCLVLIALLVSCQSDRARENEELDFPTFEPFLVLDSLGGAHDELEDPRFRLELLRELLSDWIEMGMLGDEGFVAPEGLKTVEQSSENERGKPDAYLRPLVPPLTAIWLQWMPWCLNSVEPLGDKLEWSEEEVELAQLVAEYWTWNELGVDVEFEFGRHTQNRESLGELVGSFRSLCEERRYLATMMGMFCFGPYEGLIIEPLESQEPVDRIRLSEEVEVRLFELPDGVEPFVLQGYVDGEVRWSRVISDAPHESISGVAFSERPPESSGPYGWDLELDLISNDRFRKAWVLIDRAGEFLFFLVHNPL